MENDDLVIECANYFATAMSVPPGWWNALYSLTEGACQTLNVSFSIENMRILSYDKNIKLKAKIEGERTRLFYLFNN